MSITAGIFPPLVTPLGEDKRIDAGGFERLITHVLEGGADGIFVLGTTGEGPGLSHLHRKEVVRLACGKGTRPAPVLVGITNSSYDESVRLARYAAEEGADAVVVAPPPYYVAASNELIDFLTAIGRDCPLPVFLYNIPSHTHVPIDWPTVERAASIEGIVGYKDSSGDMVQFNKVRQATRGIKDFAMMIGPEELMAESLLMGGDGAIPGGANLFPAVYAHLFKACREKRLDDAMRLNSIIISISKRLYEIDNSNVRIIRIIKEALFQMGICQNYLSFPYGQLTRDQQAIVTDRLEEVRALIDAEPLLSA